MNSLNNLNNEEILKNILRQNIKKTGQLKKALEFSLKIKEAIENNQDNDDNNDDEAGEMMEKDIVNDIADLTDKRGEIIDEIKNINAAIKYYKSKLPPKYSNIVDNIEKTVSSKQKFAELQSFPAWARNLYKMLTEQQNILANIKITDDINNEAMKTLVKVLTEKTNSIKNNRILMDKFNQIDDMPAGSLIKSKK